MRFIECSIDNFGTLSGVKIKFKNGLNSTLSDNGSGKSTLSAFLCAMLYGIGDTRKSALCENDRKRYLPWQGGSYGGSLTLSHKDRTYRIERSFGRKASEDRCDIYDRDKNTRLSLECEFGEWALGIDRDGYLRSACLSERTLSERGDNASIAAKLSDVPVTVGDIDEFDNAIKALQERRKFFLKRGGGAISELEEQLSDTDRNLSQMKETELECCNLLLEIKSLKEKRQELEAKASTSHSGASVHFFEDELRRINEELAENQGQLRECESFFGGKIPRREELGKGKKNKQAKKGFKTALGVMLILLGAILGLAISPPFYILSAFGAILTFIGLFAGTDKETGASDRQNEIAVFEKYEYLKMLITRLAEERDRYSSLVGNGIEEWNDQLRELDREIAVLEREYSVKSAELSNSDLISAKRDNLSAKLEEYRREHKILQASEKLLTEAYENMCAKYLGKASAAFRKYTDLLGGGDGYALDLSFRVTKTECGKTRENDYYSRGIKDMHALALHLALTDALYGEDAPPLILDDPFISFDDGRLSAGKKMLYALGCERQVIYLTCSSSRMP